ncbi:mediator of RNA polymerase II transcription subunit 31 [Falco naumanni]|uniref:mediator of RNA polymerase II transcription subunit 31 n=1 Tax=Falco naumanni TaxID=148594 RepID=UPI001ADE4C04|nr:mediator of RNA polymerase II transcription subunit 31 [Falco naumanni]
MAPMIKSQIQRSMAKKSASGHIAASQKSNSARSRSRVSSSKWMVPVTRSNVDPHVSSPQVSVRCRNGERAPPGSGGCSPPGPARRRGPARCQAPGAAFPECFSAGVRQASARRQRPSAAPSCAWASRAARRVAMESDDTGNRLRFQLELEFVQCLANPNYLNFLAQRGYFKDKAFVNYLKYLLYWKEPEYAKYLKYPQCLHMLELLQYEHFRKELVNAQCAKFIDEQQILHWQHYSRKRMRLQQALAEQQQQNNTSVK